MNYTFVLLLMIFCHIVDDYYLQGWLASAKQKKFWEENAPEHMYRFDYIWALIMHSFSWAFMVMLPIAFVNEFKVNDFFVFIFVCNLVVHAVTDDLKANKRIINLWTDQLIHIGQIVLTSLILFWR